MHNLYKREKPIYSKFISQVRKILTEKFLTHFVKDKSYAYDWLGVIFYPNNGLLKFVFCKYLIKT